jgi:Protein of unknown function (DUF1573)
MFRLLLLCFFLFAAQLTYGQKLGITQKFNNEDKSLNAGKVEWLDRQIETGTVAMDVPVVREFRFKNISKENLIILEVSSTCHCTVAEWPKDPILPGETSVIKVTYDAKAEGPFYRLLMLRTNFDSAASIILALLGKVEAKKE